MGFNSTVRIPARIRIAPNAARGDSTSRATRKDVTHAKTGSSEKMSAVRVGVVNCCAQLCTENDRAVASRLVTTSAITTAQLQMTLGVSNHQNEANPKTAHVAIWYSDRLSKLIWRA